MFSNGQVLRKSCVSAPHNTRNVVAFSVLSVDGNQYVANFPVEGRFAVDRRLANVAVEFQCVGVYRVVKGHYVPCKHGKHKFAFFLHRLVVTAKLSADGNFVAHFHRRRKQVFGNGHGQVVVHAGKSFDRKGYFVKFFAVGFVGKHRPRYNFPCKSYHVVLQIVHIVLLLCFVSLRFVFVCRCCRCGSYLGK